MVFGYVLSVMAGALACTVAMLVVATIKGRR